MRVRVVLLVGLLGCSSSSSTGTDGGTETFGDDGPASGYDVAPYDAGGPPPPLDASPSSCTPQAVSYAAGASCGLDGPGQDCGDGGVTGWTYSCNAGEAGGPFEPPGAT